MVEKRQYEAENHHFMVNRAARHCCPPAATSGLAESQDSIGTQHSASRTSDTTTSRNKARDANTLEP
jgi:hypothetical protein